MWEPTGHTEHMASDWGPYGGGAYGVRKRAGSIQEDNTPPGRMLFSLPLHVCITEHIIKGEEDSPPAQTPLLCPESWEIGGRGGHTSIPPAAVRQELFCGDIL